MKCSRNTPYAVVTSRVALSPFAKHRTSNEAVDLVKTTLQRFHDGESIGFSRVASLKSMGLIPVPTAATHWVKNTVLTNSIISS